MPTAPVGDLKYQRRFQNGCSLVGSESVEVPELEYICMTRLGVKLRHLSPSVVNISEHAYICS